MSLVYNVAVIPLGLGRSPIYSGGDTKARCYCTVGGAVRAPLILILISYLITYLNNTNTIKSNKAQESPLWGLSQ